MPVKESKDNPMAEMGRAMIFPSDKSLSLKICGDCKNYLSCSKGKGLTLMVRQIRHLFLPDYKNSWTLTVDLPECKQPRTFFTLARISASLYTANRAQIEGKIIESTITQFAELSVVEI